MLFKISTKKEQFINRSNAFPVLRINTEQQCVEQHCKDIISAQEKYCNSELQISNGDDDFLQVNFLFQFYRI